ncbi:hypothetical protein NP233_g8212 [Leucocoprinus birnbaumii]|uniref:Uncharacterized protein n=1 Tax=Leucocoprinus birnbaumii TaxID=56174 RepID=A0AAD5VMW4_9AGAR|nr:hypothetical protein NP233_g8212 [Leucocoprinus birnbaumii]
MIFINIGAYVVVTASCLQIPILSLGLQWQARTQGASTTPGSGYESSQGTTTLIEKMREGWDENWVVNNWSSMCQQAIDVPGISIPLLPPVLVIALRFWSLVMPSVHVMSGEPERREDIRRSSGMSSLWITNVRLPPPALSHSEEENYDGTWTVKCSGGIVTDLLRTSDHTASTSDNVQILNANGGIMIPSLCHSHIHLDKCFILDQCGDLTNGDFKEAMTITAKAKAGFPSSLDDLQQRGSRLIEDSVENGVTSMRAHVEVDTVVGFSCLDVALDLKSRYKDVCDVQIAVFAQEPLFESPSETKPGKNYNILCEAMKREGVSAVGSAPYVEPTTDQAKKNIKLIFEAVLGSQGTHLASPRHIDFHLDYNLDSAMEPLIYEVIAQARTYYSLRNFDCASEDNKLTGIQHTQDAASQPHCKINQPVVPSITIGHATRLQLLSAAEWLDLRTAIGDLPLTIVGLPQSDMYIQGRAHAGTPLGPPRSTLRVPLIEKAYGIKVAMAVNNVDNAFTPQGTLDPLGSLVTFGVAVFQAVTPREIRTLIEAVTLTSKRAISFLPDSFLPNSTTTEEGNEPVAEEKEKGTRHAAIPADLFPTRGDPADFVVLHENQSLRSAALHPSFNRTTIKAGRVVARRSKWRWISGEVTEASARQREQ